MKLTVTSQASRKRKLDRPKEYISNTIYQKKKTSENRKIRNNCKTSITENTDGIETLPGSLSMNCKTQKKLSKGTNGLREVLQKNLELVWIKYR